MQITGTWRQSVFVYRTHTSLCTIGVNHLHTLSRSQRLLIEHSIPTSINYLFDNLTSEYDDVMVGSLNIRKTVNNVKRELTRYLKTIIFKNNDSQMRKEITLSINNKLNVIKQSGWLIDYLVVCNDDNNTLEDLNNETLNISVLIVPTKAIRQIYLKINLFKNTISITET